MPASGRRRRVAPQHAGALAGEQLGRAVAVDDGQHRPLAASSRPAAVRSRRRSAPRSGSGCGSPSARRRLDGGARRRRCGRAPSSAPHRRRTPRWPPIRRARRAARAAASAPSASQPPSRYITSNCGGAGVRGGVRRQRGAAPARTRARCGACPVIVAVSASSRTSRPRPPGVDHAGVGQHVELLGGLLQRDHRGVAGGDDRLRQPVAVAGALLDGARRRPAAPRRSCPATSSPPIEATTSSTAAPQRRTEQRGVDVVQLAARSRRPRARSTSAMPRRICDRITPELPRAPCSAPADSAAAVWATSSDFGAASASASAERMVNSMFAPVSASATGNTLSRLISSMWVIRSLTAVCAQSRNAGASSRRPGSSPDPTSLHLLAPPRCAPAYPIRGDSTVTRRLPSVDRFGGSARGRYPGQVVGSPG